MNARYELVAALAILACGSACGHTSAAETKPAPAAAPHGQPRHLVVPAPEPPPSARIGDAMLDHFLITSFARGVVIAGLLEPLRDPLQALADYRYEDKRASDDWMPWITQLQTAARSTSQAATLEAAGMGVAEMARICGDCHVATRGGPVWTPAMAAEEERRELETVDERMSRHIWSAEQLWKGLIGPSDAHWRAGARALTDAPAELDGQLPEEFDDELRGVRALGQLASEATTPAARANVYGTLIGTCAKCHSRWIDHTR